jgi:hypothetical protein
MTAVEPTPAPIPRRPPIPPMPEAIAAAISGIQGSIRRVEKDGHNTDGGNYRFASVDAFFEFIGPLLAEHGLIIDMDEMDEGAEYYVVTKTYKGGGASEQRWMRARFAFTIQHRSGVAWSHNPIRTVDVMVTGPQAYGSAQSYAFKQYLRTLFKIPTGEREDVDYHRADADDGYGPGRSGDGRWRRDERPGDDNPPPGATVTPREIDDLLRRLRKELAGCATAEAVNALAVANADRLEEVRDAAAADYEAIKVDFKAHRRAVAAKAAVAAPPAAANDAVAEPADDQLPPEPWTIDPPRIGDGSPDWAAFANEMLRVIQRIPDAGWGDKFVKLHARQVTEMRKVKDPVGTVAGAAMTGEQAATCISAAFSARMDAVAPPTAQAAE